jgi:hypothetical protein
MYSFTFNSALLDQLVYSTDLQIGWVTRLISKPVIPQKISCWDVANLIVFIYVPNIFNLGKSSQYKAVNNVLFV